MHSSARDRPAWLCNEDIGEPVACRSSRHQRASSTRVNVTVVLMSPRGVSAAVTSDMVRPSSSRRHAATAASRLAAAPPSSRAAGLWEGRLDILDDPYSRKVRLCLRERGRNTCNNTSRRCDEGEDMSAHDLSEKSLV